MQFTLTTLVQPLILITWTTVMLNVAKVTSVTYCNVKGSCDAYESISLIVLRTTAKAHGVRVCTVLLSYIVCPVLLGIRITCWEDWTTVYRCVNCLVNVNVVCVANCSASCNHLANLRDFRRYLRHYCKFLCRLVVC